MDPSWNLLFRFYWRRAKRGVLNRAAALLTAIRHA